MERSFAAGPTVRQGDHFSLISITAAVFIASAVGATLVGGLVWLLQERIGVSAWESHPYYLWLYALGLSASSATSAATERPHWRIVIHAVLAIALFVLSVRSSIGFPTIVAAVAIFGISATLGRAATTVGESQYSFMTAFLTAVVTTGVIGSWWVVETAPAHAEGFVVLAWLVFAATNFLTLTALSLLLTDSTRARRRRWSPQRIVGLIAVCIGALALSAAAVFYMIYVEGEPQLPLEDSSEWDSAFVRLSDTRTTPQYEAPRVSRAQFIEYLAKQEQLSVSQLATLYLLTGDERWAKEFKRTLLDEATRNAHTEGGGSVKYGQRKFITRGMYFDKVRSANPALFDAEESRLITDWFETALQAIFRPGWVDYLYAVPFRDNPDGPYLNQEIGAGAVAALLPHVTTPELRAQAERFLEEKSAGFLKNYRNPDDSLEYHQVWIESAWPHYQYYLKSSRDAALGIRLAFDWFMQQLPNDATQFNYGLPGSFRPLVPLSIAAFHLGDEEARWLLDRHLERAIAHNEPLPYFMIGFSAWNDDVKAARFLPGSMLLNGPTGYAFRPGPLAGDKVILRKRPDGQQTDSIFAVANLRNIGWHRYPATNTATRISMAGEVIVNDHVIDKKHGWLPAGRARHRDKKIDRSRLNGLQIERSGIDAWFGHITGVYSRWRQDPPRTATVASRSEQPLSVTLRIADWAGMDHERTYSLPSPNELLVTDRVSANGISLDKKITWFTQNMRELSDQMLVQDLADGRQITIDITADQAVHIATREDDSRTPSSYSEFEPDLVTDISIKSPGTTTVVTRFRVQPAG